MKTKRIACSGGQFGTRRIRGYRRRSGDRWGPQRMPLMLMHAAYAKSSQKPALSRNTPVTRSLRSRTPRVRVVFSSTLVAPTGPSGLCRKSPSETAPSSRGSSRKPGNPLCRKTPPKPLLPVAARLVSPETRSLRSRTSRVRGAFSSTLVAPTGPSGLSAFADSASQGCVCINFGGPAGGHPDSLENQP
jgi:hypothetical protein